MSAWSKILSPEERAEVEALVVGSYVDAETGETRATSEAKAEFWSAVEQAQRAGRLWADVLIEEWAERGAGTFAAELWKRRDAFTTTVRGQQRVRALRRGKKIKREDGTSLDVQASLLTWSIHDLREAMQAERMRATETRINLDTYDRLARLCESTGCDMVTDALESVGMSLDEYLAAEDVA